MHRLCGPGIVAPEDDCLKAMAIAFSRLKLVLEPGGAIALAAALFHGDQIEGDDVIAIASGGNVDPEIFTMALQKHGDLA
jgi:threonine dehydratase